MTGKLQHKKNIQVDDFLYLKSTGQSKFHSQSMHPSPTMVHFRGGRKAIDIHAYPDMDEFFEDLAQVYREGDQCPLRGWLPLHPT